MSFDPASIPGLILRLPADSGLYQDAGGMTPAVADGDPVRRRNSTAGTAYATPTSDHGTLKLSVINGRPAVRHAPSAFTTGWNLANFSLSEGQGWTLFLSQRCSARGFTPVGTGSGFVTAGPANYYGLNATAYFTNRGSGPAISSDDQELLVLKSTPSGVVWRQNGVQTNISAALTAGPVTSDLALWGFAGNGNWPYFGDDFETLWYDRILSDSEIAQDEEYLLANVPAYDPGTSDPLLLFAGNSLVAGVGATLNANEMPNAALAAIGPGWHRLNQGIGGTTTATWASTYKAPRIDPYYSAGRPRNLAIFWELSNTIQSGVDGPTAYAEYRSFAASLVASGWTVILLDCLPRSLISGAKETARASANAGLAGDFTGATSDARVFLPASGTTYAHALVRVSQIAAMSDPTNTTYFTDGTHLTDAGYALVAADVAAAAVSLPAVSPAAFRQPPAVLGSGVY
jgi:lysophospholipase L1-like esterase